MNKKFVVDLLTDIIGSFLLAIGIFSFVEKVNIAPGGMSGVAIMIKHILGLPVGITIFVLNIPLLIISYKFIGKRFFKRTFRTLFISTIVLDLIVSRFFPQYEGERILGAIFGGVIMGLGLGIIFLRGSTTAGTDIISILVEKKYPHIQVGKALMMVDGVIILFSILVFKNVESALFGVVALFFQTKVIDSIVYGAEKGREILIISDKNEEIAKRILKERDRGATFINSEGAYSGKKSKILMCIIRAWEYYYIKEIILKEDPNAFIVVLEAQGVMGEGFSKDIKKRKKA